MVRSMVGAPELKSSFPPVVDEDTRLLILGSLPSELSLAANQYYANPRNQFWQLMSRVTERDLMSAAYQKRIEILLQHGVGLWDTLASAERVGSLDADIRNATPNDLVSLGRRLPRLRLIAFNGSKSAKVGLRVLANYAWPTITLPQSSPARAMPFEDKASAWLKLRDYLV